VSLFCRRIGSKLRRADAGQTLRSWDRNRSVRTQLSLHEAEPHFWPLRRYLRRVRAVACVARGGPWQRSSANPFPHYPYIETKDQEWTSCGLLVDVVRYRDLSNDRAFHIARGIPSGRLLVPRRDRKWPDALRICLPRRAVTRAQFLPPEAETHRYMLPPVRQSASGLQARGAKWRQKGPRGPQTRSRICATWAKFGIRQ